MNRRVLVTGSRDWRDVQAVRDALVRVADTWQRESIVLVSGACPTGADAIAERLARREFGWAVERHPAEWNVHGKGAGFKRNAHMVQLGADLCLAFIRNGSRGASHTAALAEAASIPTVCKEAA